MCWDGGVNKQGLPPEACILEWKGVWLIKYACHTHVTLISGGNKLHDEG